MSNLYSKWRDRLVFLCLIAGYWNGLLYMSTMKDRVRSYGAEGKDSRGSEFSRGIVVTCGVLPSNSKASCNTLASWRAACRVSSLACGSIRKRILVPAEPPQPPAVIETLGSQCACDSWRW